MGITAQQEKSVYGTMIGSGSGTFTIPQGVSAMKVTVVGGGGGSGGVTGTGIQTNVSGGGGGGATTIQYLVGLTPGATLNYSVGVGGSAGSPGAAGGAGGTTTVSSGTQTITSIVAGGGTGGNGASDATQIGASGSGGTGSGGVTVNGGAGYSAPQSAGSYGGCSLYSTIRPPTQQDIAGMVAIAGNGFGGGASPTSLNGTGSRSGAVGSGGVIIFEW